MKIERTDPDKWLVRKRNGKWWIFAPHDQLPLVELPRFGAVQAWSTDETNTTEAEFDAMWDRATPVDTATPEGW